MIRTFKKIDNLQKIIVIESVDEDYILFQTLGKKLDFHVFVDEKNWDYFVENGINYNFITQTLSKLRNENDLLQNSKCFLLNYTVNTDSSLPTYNQVIAFTTKFE
jgi:hypothetical protein